MCIVQGYRTPLGDYRRRNANQSILQLYKAPIVSSFRYIQPSREYIGFVRETY